MTDCLEKANIDKLLCKYLYFNIESRIVDHKQSAGLLSEEERMKCSFKCGKAREIYISTMLKLWKIRDSNAELSGYIRKKLNEVESLENFVDGLNNFVSDLNISKREKKKFEKSVVKTFSILNGILRKQFN